MFDAGLVEEVEHLLAAGLSPNCTAMQAIGYKEVAQYLSGECALDEAVDTVCRASRRYAKRQLTWLRSRPDIRWLRWEAEPGRAALDEAARTLAEEYAGRPFNS